MISIRCRPSMCKSRRHTQVSTPTPRRPPPLPGGRRPSCEIPSSTSFSIDGSSDNNATPASGATFTSKSSISSHASLASIYETLADTPILFPFSEIAAATNKFLAKRLSYSSAAAWRCSLRGRDAVVVQRTLGRHGADPNNFTSRLAAACRGHHGSLVPLLGASLAGNHLYLVYEYAAGATLAECLRNSRNPSFTQLSSWTSRVEIADDVAQGLSYIHLHSSTAVHGQIKSSTIIVSEPKLRAKICHYAASHLAGDIASDEETPASITRSDSGHRSARDASGYMAPEILGGGGVSQSGDVFAFGVVLLEILTGEKPLRYQFDRTTSNFDFVSVIDTARAALEKPGEEEADGRAATAGVGIRRWMDERLRDSYPVEAAEALVRVAFKCVAEDAVERPGMEWVAGKISKVLLDSMAWKERVRVPTDFSVSMAPR